MIAVTVPFALSAWSLWQTGAAQLDAETIQRMAATGVDTNFGETFGRGLTGDDARFWLRLAGAVVACVSAWSAALAVGVLARREAARYAALVTFLMFALIAIPHGVGGWFLEPRPTGLLTASLAAGATAAVVWLLATTQVADDVARATFYRLRRRHGRPGGRGPGGPSDDFPLLAA